MNEQVKRPTFFGACPHDCPDTCAMIYEVDDGKLVNVQGQQGASDHARHAVREAQGLPRPPPQSRPPDVPAAPRRPQGLRPQRRQYFERITWDEAISEIGRRWREIIAEYGAQAIMPQSYLGNMGLVQGINSGDPFFNRLGSTVNEKTYCTSGSSTAWLLTHGPTGGVDPESFVHCKYIVIWACNSISTNLHHWPFVLEAQKRGAKVVVIDSYKSRTAKAGDWHICPKPGTDGALALAIINSMVEQGVVDQDYVDNHTHGWPELKARAAEFTLEYAEKVTGVKAADIAKFAYEFATSQPSAIRIGVAIERSAGGAQALARRLRNSGGRRLVAPRRRRHAAAAAVGLPRRLGEGGAARLDQAGHARRQQPAARPGAHRRDEARSADQEPVRVLHQSRQPVARDQQDRRGPEARGPVHGRRRALHHRHGEIRRHHPALRHGRRGRGHDVVVGPLLLHLQSEGRRPAGRMQADERDVAAAGQGDGLRRSGLQNDRQRAVRRLHQLGRPQDGRHRHGVFQEARLLQDRRRLRDTRAPHAEGKFPTPSGKVELLLHDAKNFVAGPFRAMYEGEQDGAPIDPLPGYVPVREVAGDQSRTSPRPIRSTSSRRRATASSTRATPTSRTRSEARASSS